MNFQTFSINTRPNYRQKRNRSVFLTTLFLLTVTSVPTSLKAQQPWEYSPYNIYLLDSWGVDLPVGEQTKEAIRENFLKQCINTGGPLWEVQSQKLSPAETFHIYNWENTKSPTLKEQEALQGISQKYPLSDKLFFIHIEYNKPIWKISLRELDCHTYRFSLVEQQELVHTSLIATAVTRLVKESFSPLAKIDDYKNKSATLTFKGIGLITEETHFALPPTGSLLTATIRKNNRQGTLQPRGLYQVPWTYLQVTKQNQHKTDSLVVSSAGRPLGSRANRRTQKLAQFLKPQTKKVLLSLRSTYSPETPLVGYHLYRVGAEGIPNEFIGATDSQGQIRLPTTPDTPLDLYYIKHGAIHLAKIPVAAGSPDLQQVLLVDDAQRLAAEGFLHSLHNKLIETIAHRELLASQIRHATEQKQKELAYQLLEKLENLPSKNDFIRTLRERQIELNSNLLDLPEETAQKLRPKILTMFEHTRQEINDRLTLETLTQAQKLVASLKDPN
ncbi:MAG: hypothetical protein MPJ24_06055 [Pirellulaceae bacterium]|nr:hypothetical protein [Pirellulaceae bacterium]